VPTATRRLPYLAHLRVLEPVEFLPEPQRARWTAYAVGAPSRSDLETRHHTETVRRLAGRPPVPVPAAESEGAVVVEVDGQVYVSPEQPRLAVWRELDSLVPGGGEPSGVPGTDVPDAVRAQAVADLARWLDDGGEPRLFALSCAWQVPLAWFVPFAGDDRELQLDGFRSLRYRTSMGAARRRTAVALRQAREGLGDVDVVDDIEQVGRWLEDFDPRALVELDYGGLVDLLDDTHLRGDDSAADVAAGLAAVAEGDTTSAAAVYQRWTTRWERVLLLARAS
jgi:hypothetical protein